ncbi:MAG: hypothetical protein M0R48_01155 [Candidatus Omnitrophica bacterium]|jgi:hypothetical protein|nr:hypothetical protein [Candidatus Omnitrophota bacterium]
MMQIESFFPFIVFLAFFVIIYISSRKGNETLKKLSTHFNGSVVKFAFYPTFYGEHHGLKFSIKLIPASKSTPPRLKISLIKSSFLKLSIYREGFLSNVGKRLRIIREVKINDELFNKEFLIFSNNSKQAISHLSDEAVKTAARELFNEGFEYIIANCKTFTIQKPNYVLERDLDAKYITSILQKLILFSKGL